MTDQPQPDAAASPARKPFRRAFARTRMPADEAARQGRVAAAAWSALRDRDAVMTFLNAHDDALGGRPLDLAVGSEEGLLAVERAIADRASARG